MCIRDRCLVYSMRRHVSSIDCRCHCSRSTARNRIICAGQWWARLVRSRQSLLLCCCCCVVDRPAVVRRSWSASHDRILWQPDLQLHRNYRLLLPPNRSAYVQSCICAWITSLKIVDMDEMSFRSVSTGLRRLPVLLSLLQKIYSRWTKL